MYSLNKQYCTQFTSAPTLSHHLCNSYIANKRGFVQIIPPSWGLSYQFDWHAINRSRRYRLGVCIVIPTAPELTHISLGTMDTTMGCVVCMCVRLCLWLRAVLFIGIRIMPGWHLPNSVTRIGTTGVAPVRKLVVNWRKVCVNLSWLFDMSGRKSYDCS